MHAIDDENNSDDILNVICDANLMQLHYKTYVVTRYTSNREVLLLIVIV